jgi:hypothetical protein
MKAFYPPKPPKITYRQEGDDGYCYCVRVDGRAVTYASLTRSEAMAEKRRILAQWYAAQRANPVCQWLAGCERPPVTTKAHRLLGDVPICQPCADRMERLS